MSLLPCASCPWRIDQEVSAIPNYVHEKACGLMNTVGRGDGLRPIMACHGSTDNNMHACRGYLVRAGWSNITVRILLANKQIEDPDAVSDACQKAGIKLHKTYPEVLRKLSRGSGNAYGRGSGMSAKWYAKQPYAGFSEIREEGTNRLIFALAHPSTKCGDAEPTAEEKYQWLRWIAAAPAMYDALKLLPLDAFDKPMEEMDAADFVDNSADFVNAMELAREALRKADGETNGTD